MDHVRYLIVILAMIFTGVLVFVGGVLLFPDIRPVLDKDPDASFMSYGLFIDVLSFMIFVSVSTACFFANLMSVSGFEPGLARTCSILATVPMLFCGPAATIAEAWAGQWATAAICATATVVTAGSIYALNRYLRKYARETPRAASSVLISSDKDEDG